MKRTLLTLIAVATAALTPVAEAAQPAGMSKAPKARNACFTARNVNNFAAVDDQNLYVRVGVRDVYHLTMFGNCFDLSWVNALGLVSRGGSFICEGDLTGVDVVTREAGGRPMSCPVSNIRKLTPEEIAALPKRARP